PAREGAQEFLELEPNVPVLLVLGGSLGSERINNVILEALPELVQRYQVIHQTGQANFDTVQKTSQIILEHNERRYRYKPYGYLAPLAMKMSAGAAELVISRAGSGGIAEIASWSKASIIIPIPESVSRDQRSNAFAYARSGAATVVEETNLTPHILLAEIDRLFTNPKARNDMAAAAAKFTRKDAARILAEAVLEIGLEHAS
ncbi:MAG: glycosyltransferase, partial [Patescibacteria group bacterium]